MTMLIKRGRHTVLPPKAPKPEGKNCKLCRNLVLDPEITCGKEHPEMDAANCNDFKNVGSKNRKIVWSY